jgi:pimeloyl-ACP methyl ester carboxylesterase
MLRYGTIRTRRDNAIVYATVGPDDGGSRAPVVLIHPINLRKECWFGMVPALATDRMCIVIDLAGHGESNDDMDFGLSAWVSDCVDVVTALGLDAFHLVGGSLGGVIVLCIAAELQARALSVTAVGAYAGDAEEPGGSGLSGMVDRYEIDELFDILAAEAIAPGTAPAVVDTVRHLTNRHGKPVVRRVIEAAAAADPSEWLPRVTCPVQVLTGEFDSSCTPRDGERLAASVGGKHHVLTGLGHLPMIEDPDALLQAVLPLVDR